MSGFLGRWPDNFVPEEHGWVKQPLDDLPDTWVRWEPPFKLPASISRCLHDQGTGAVGGWYMGPFRGLYVDQVTQAEAHEEMLRTDLNELNSGERSAGCRSKAHAKPGAERDIHVLDGHHPR